jgi:hypothetical protein
MEPKALHKLPLLAVLVVSLMGMNLYYSALAADSKSIQTPATEPNIVLQADTSPGARRWVTPHHESFNTDELRCSTLVVVFNPNQVALRVSIDVFDEEGRFDQRSSARFEIPAMGVRRHELPFPALAPFAFGWLLVSADPIALNDPQPRQIFPTGNTSCTRFAPVTSETRASRDRTMIFYPLD